MTPTVTCQTVHFKGYREGPAWTSEASGDDRDPIRNLTSLKGDRVKVVGKVFKADKYGDFVLLLSEDSRGVVHRIGISLADFERFDAAWNPQQFTVQTERKRLGRGVQASIRELRSFEKRYGLGKYADVLKS